MSQDILIDIAPDANHQVRLNVKGPNLPRGGQEFLRPLPSFDAARLKQLRQDPDSLPAPELQKLIVDVSQWLLGTELAQYVNDTLRMPGPALRFVFSISRRLQATFADIPLELLQYNGQPLVLNKQVAALVYQLDKVGDPAATVPLAWPLRVLIVRSNPPDLGGLVPETKSIRDSLEELAGRLTTPNSIQVDLLSRETGAIGVPTWRAMRAQLRRTAYHLIVYLGHGDLEETAAGVEPQGVLLFEDEKTGEHDAVSAQYLAGELQEQPVPLVLLTACLSAAEATSEMKEGIEEALPQWLRGSQGVAQAIVNGPTGVQCAVGMRFPLRADAAPIFLAAFFEGLLKKTPGDVEAALREARMELRQTYRDKPTYAAPLMFRTPGEEPTFPFLAQPQTTTTPTTTDGGNTSPATQPTTQDKPAGGIDTKDLVGSPGTELEFAL